MGKLTFFLMGAIDTSSAQMDPTNKLKIIIN